MSIRFTYNDKEYEFRGEYRAPKEGNSFLDNNGTVISPCHSNWSGIRAIVHPVLVRHTFGGIVFEETGEKRSTTFGDWFLDNNSIPHSELWHQPYNSLTPYTILIPVEVVDGKDD